MDLTDNSPLLFNDIFSRSNLSLSEKYRQMRELYKSGNTYVLSNNVNLFAPFPKSDVPWDISNEEKIAIYNPEISSVLNWIKSRIIANLGIIEYKTLDVLIRIATGMLNKVNIPKETKILFHDNMVHNLKAEYYLILDSDLPF